MVDLPFHYFGGKRQVTKFIWERLFEYDVYIEPFFGSGSIFLNRPEHTINKGIAIVNDIDGFVVNFWRAIKESPDEVAYFADNPSNECDLHSRHIYLTNNREEVKQKVSENIDWYDAKIAGWWVWGLCNWIGSGWCNSRGPWYSVNGVLTKSKNRKNNNGIRKQILSFRCAGIQRKLLYENQLCSPNPKETLCEERHYNLTKYFEILSSLLQTATIYCNNWIDVLSINDKQTFCIVLDPPYPFLERFDKIYTEENNVFHDVLQWCIENGERKNLRIALCGYEDEHNQILCDIGWEVFRWKANGGYGNQSNKRGRENCQRETIWFSPYCINELKLFNIKGG